MTEFTPWPKIPRLRREMIITEKIDGTNACLVIREIQPNEVDKDMIDMGFTESTDEDGQPYEAVCGIFAQSRKRFITPDADNFGFATWVQTNAEALINKLGIGRHFGEWWGLGIQRGYDLNERRFSLFNIKKWDELMLWEHGLTEIGVHVVPTLNSISSPDDGYPVFDTNVIELEVEWLREHGSVAAPGYKDPEGVVVRHMMSGQMYKRLLENDDVPKSEVTELGDVLSTGELVMV